MNEDRGEPGLEPAGDGDTRREFLAQVAIAGAGLAVGPLLGGGQASAAAPPGGEASVAITLEVNGRSHALEIDPRASLLDALRERIGLTGTKKGCDHGACGACTVLIDGRRVNSCLTLAVMAAGKPITTIEGLAQGDQLHPVQTAFITHDGFQCGYCTPGQICSAVGLLTEGVARDDAAIREAMSGNLCRCGAYPNIIAAVRDVLDRSAT